MAALLKVVYAPLPPPEFKSLSGLGSTNGILTWNATSGSTYRVQYVAHMLDTNWVTLPPDIVARSNTASLADNPAGATSRFYRILLIAP